MGANCGCGSKPEDDDSAKKNNKKLLDGDQDDDDGSEDNSRDNTDNFSQVSKQSDLNGMQDESQSIDVENDELNTSQIRKKVCLKDFIILKVLGRGSFGKVMLVQKKDQDTLYAMKILRKEAILKMNQIIHTKAERNILENMKHNHIVQLHYAFQTSEKLYFVMDFMSGGELFFHLRRANMFNEERSKLYAAELILAIEYMHKKNVIYRDLKPENILLGSDGHIKIADFGLSKQGVEDGVKTNTFCGTPEYLAPEILMGQGHDKSVDWWSLGALLYEMLSGAPPFYSRDQKKMFQNRLEKPYEMKFWFSPNAISVLQGLLCNDPKKRLGLGGAIEIKQHPFFSDIDWEALDKKKIEPPFKPKLADDKDLKNFDKMFTNEPVRDTPIKNAMENRPENNFDQFTYMPNDMKQDQEIDTGAQQEHESKDQFLEYNQNFSLKPNNLQH